MTRGDSSLSLDGRQLALFIFFIPPLFVPLYYFQRYRPRKKEKHDDKNA
jgi:hypothetical protein